MKKKILAVILATLAVISLAACRKIEDSSDSTNKVVDNKEVDYSSYVKLGDYKGFKIEVDPADVTDKQLKDKIDSIIKDNTEPEKLTTGTVKDKDTINLDYSGKLDGVAFDNGTAKDQTYTIGGGFIQSLNDQLIGLEVGKTYDLNCKFPDDYTNNKDLAGKDVVFTVTVNYIEGEDIVPEWNDAFVKEISKGDYTTTTDYEAYLKKQLQAENESGQETQFESGIWEKIIENADISDFPEEKLNDSYDSYYNYYKNYYSYMAQYYGSTYEEFLKLYNMTDEDVKSNCMEQAKTELQYIMLACVIADKEKIAIGDEEYQSLAGDVLESFSYNSIEEFESDYGKEYINESFLFKKVNDYLKDQCTMVIKDSSEEETTTAAE